MHGSCRQLVAHLNESKGIDGDDGIAFKVEAMWILAAKRKDRKELK